MNPAEAIEASQLDLFWLPAHVETRARPELCCLRSDEPVLHYNAALRCHPTPGDTVALVREISEWHKHGCSRVHLYPSNRTDALEAALIAEGYIASFEHDAMAIDVTEYAVRPAPGLVVRRVETLEQLVDCVGVLRETLGVTPPTTDEAWQEQLRDCTGDQARTHRYVAYDRASGRPLSSGGLNLYPDLGLGHLWGGGTVPTGRKRGAYSAVVAARVAATRELGLRYVGLFARHGESSPIVTKQGFQAHGRMSTWDRSLARAQTLYASTT